MSLQNVDGKRYRIAQHLSLYINSTELKRIHNTKLGAFYENHAGAKEFIKENGGLRHLCESYPTLLRYDEDPETHQHWIYSGSSVKHARASSRGHPRPPSTAQASSNAIVPRSPPSTALIPSALASLLPSDQKPKDVKIHLDSNGQGMQMTATYEEVKMVTEKIRPNYVVAMTVDISGSMSGKNAEQTLLATNDIIKQLRPKDKVAMVCFNNNVLPVIPLQQKKNVSFPECIQEHLEAYDGKPMAAFKCSGGTALWDSIATSMEILRENSKIDKNSHPFLIVLTDGEEQESTRHDIISIQTMLSTPGIANFHASFITVGAEDDAHVRTLRDMTDGKPHLYHLNAVNADAIGGCFRKISVKIEQVVTKQVTVSVDTNEAVDRRKDGKRIPPSSSDHAKSSSSSSRSSSRSRSSNRINDNISSNNNGINRRPASHPFNLYVENLDLSIDDDILRSAFSQFGNIISSKVITNRDGTSKGYGFVAFSSAVEIQSAIAGTNGKMLGTKPIKVSIKVEETREKEARPSSVPSSVKSHGTARSADRGMPIHQEGKSLVTL